MATKVISENISTDVEGQTVLTKPNKTYEIINLRMDQLKTLAENTTQVSNTNTSAELEHLYTNTTLVSVDNRRNGPLWLIFGLLLIVFNSIALIALHRCQGMCLQIKILSMNLAITDLALGFTSVYSGVLIFLPEHCLSQTIQVNT